MTAPGRLPPPNCMVIDGDTVAACVELLQHGMSLTVEQAKALLEGNVSAFETGLPSADDRRQVQEAATRSPALPPAGKWEYKVIPLSEMMGFATAKGTAERMQSALNTFAADGWELVTTSERDSRWLSGETVLLTLRRYIVTEHMFATRVRAEETIRRSVQQELDDARGS